MQTVLDARPPALARPVAPGQVTPWMGRAEAAMALAVAALLVASIVALSVHSGDRIRGVGRLTADGNVVLAPKDGAEHAVTQRTDLSDGDTVRVIEGHASIEMANGATLELRSGSQLRAAAAPTLVAGDALAVAHDGSVTLHGTTGDVAVPAGAAARIRQGRGMSVGVYQGSSALRSGVQTLTIPPLRQALAADEGVVDEAPTALLYRPTDEWDKRFLARVIEFTTILNDRQNGFNAQLGGGESRSLGFYKTILPALSDNPAFSAGLSPSPTDDTRTPGENLIGAAIALASSRPPAEFATTWQTVFTLRSQGGTWGLVAVDLGANDVAALSDTVEMAISRFFGQGGVASSSRTTVPRGPGATFTTPTTNGTRPTTTVTTRGSTTTPTTRPNTPTTTPTTPTTGLLPPVSNVPILGPLVDPLVDPVIDALNGAVNGLLH